ncbi:MAG: hypothetical protein ACI32C_04400 [Candidatus Enteromonas sp.]
MRKEKLLFQNRNGAFVHSNDFQSARYLRVSDSNYKNLPLLYETPGDCCGCTACYSACPKSGDKREIVVNGISLETTGAITMMQDKEGFLYPVVDAEACIKCKKCMTVCAFQRAKKQ